MTEEKFKRTVIAVTVGAVLLVVVLVSVMFYQLIAISVRKKQIAELETEIERYMLLNEEERKSIETRKQYWWIVQRARELGYVFEGDVIG